MYPSPHLVSVCVYTWEMLKICSLSKIQAYCVVLLMVIFKVYARRTHLPYIIGGHKRNLHALWPTSPLHVTLCFPEGLHQIQWDLEILGIWVTQKRWWQEGAGGTRKRALWEDGAAVTFLCKCSAVCGCPFIRTPETFLADLGKLLFTGYGMSISG